ncbi:delta endotoxin C-terminal domain-containing protein [Bacillus cereus]|uniref:delta endotoxin C-terminal domain-containing protein n=1 Tax=Bacillus cereus TaxID=1396 RepID=UPI000330BB25|nr:delta endotoxin C-terminal domain-containing protein [Bacillus cereus]EOO23276.1 hypothetical protein ICC_06162 [Bacillus cereus BAG1X1-1]EOO42875.1 hypothetical protein ICI_06251 [Bacillus cereus BAG1X2-1]EOP00101.1 hypothetical protein ICO_06528 [Bacillus cereus BAG2O-1]
MNTTNSSDIQVNPGPEFTGGDLVRMNPQSGVTYNVTPANQQAAQSSVGIRLRYACQGTASLRITLGNGSTQVIPLVSTTTSINGLQYEHFDYVTVSGDVNFP